MHISVLLDECLEYLNLQEDSMIVDATLGYGGHSSEILKKISKGFLFAFDQDQEAIDFSQTRLKAIGSNYEIIKNNFIYLKKELQNRQITQVNGILFDLGVSSPQLDNQERGFSFHQDAKLDMRMDQDSPLTAYYVINNYSYEDLVKIFYRYGEEKYAPSIAKKIVNMRLIKPIETTLELVEVIKMSVPERYKREKHPARKVFQALRIEVNNELEVLKDTLKEAIPILKVGGRVCVITFHSLEDKICKEVFKEYSAIDNNLKSLPMIPEEYQPKFKIIANVEPSEAELAINKRSRSAKLRVIERIRE